MKLQLLITTAMVAGALEAAAQGTATPRELQTGNLWIRAVQAPNYHKYLQTKPANTPGTAILDSYTTAGQFNIVDGQLVNKIANPPLYMWVEEPADKASPPRTLATWFNTTKSTLGTFAFQGDAVSWTSPSIKRQNTAAWLVCKGQALFINTGAFNYQTPAGCSDQTVSELYCICFERPRKLTCFIRYISITTRRPTIRSYAAFRISAWRATAVFIVVSEYNSSPSMPNRGLHEEVSHSMPSENPPMLLESHLRISLYTLSLGYLVSCFNRGIASSTASDMRIHSILHCVKFWHLEHRFIIIQNQWI